MNDNTEPDSLSVDSTDGQLDERSARKADNLTLGMALAISMIAGVVVGAALGNIGLWIAIAVGVGVAVGVGLNQTRNKARKRH